MYYTKGTTPFPMTKNGENSVSCTDWQTHSHVDGRGAADQLIALALGDFCGLDMV